VTKKKTKKTIVKEPAVTEMMGFKLGDHVWAIYLDKKVIQGTIDRFYPKNKSGTAVSIITSEMGYRNVLLETLSKSQIKISRKK